MPASASPIAVAGQQAVRACLWQAVATGLLAVIAAFAAGGRAGVAVLVGGGIATLGAGYLALAIYKQRPGRAPGLFVWDVFLSWAVKLALVISLLVIAFRSQQLPPEFLMAGLLGAMLAHWLSLSMAGAAHGSVEVNLGSDRDGS